MAFGMKAIALPDVNGGQSNKGKDNHGNKASQLAQDDGKKDETEKGYTNGNDGKG